MQCVIMRRPLAALRTTTRACAEVITARDAMSTLEAATARHRADNWHSRRDCTDGHRCPNRYYDQNAEPAKLPATERVRSYVMVIVENEAPSLEIRRWSVNVGVRRVRFGRFMFEAGCNSRWGSPSACIKTGTIVYAELPATKRYAAFSPLGATRCIRGRPPRQCVASEVASYPHRADCQRDQHAARPREDEKPPPHNGSAFNSRPGAEPVRIIRTVPPAGPLRLD